MVAQAFNPSTHTQKKEKKGERERKEGRKGKKKGILANTLDFVVIGGWRIEPRALNMLVECSTSELHP